MDKLSELSKPIGVSFKSDVALMKSGRMIHGQMTVWRAGSEIPVTTEGVYSQEYVSSLLAALRNIYAACDTGERRKDGSISGVAMPDRATVDSVRALLESIDNG